MNSHEAPLYAYPPWQWFSTQIQWEPSGKAERLIDAWARLQRFTFYWSRVGPTHGQFILKFMKWFLCVTMAEKHCFNFTELLLILLGHPTVSHLCFFASLSLHLLFYIEIHTHTHTHSLELCCMHLFSPVPSAVPYAQQEQNKFLELMPTWSENMLTCVITSTFPSPLVMVSLITGENLSSDQVTWFNFVTKDLGPSLGQGKRTN